MGRRLVLLWGSLSAQRKEGPQDLRRHPDAAPLLGGGNESGEDERETGPLPGEPRDHLRPAPALKGLSIICKFNLYRPILTPLRSRQGL